MTNDKSAVILGYDMVSSLGIDLEEQWNNAENGISGIGELTRFPLSEKFPVKIAGQVRDFDTGPYPLRIISFAASVDLQSPDHRIRGKPCIL